MFLKKIKNYRYYIAVGQFSFIFAIFFSNVIGGGHIYRLLTHSELPEIWVYLCNGVAGLLLGISIVFNIRGLLLYRQTKQYNP